MPLIAGAIGCATTFFQVMPTLAAAASTLNVIHVVPPKSCARVMEVFRVQVSVLGVPDIVQLDDEWRLTPPVCVIAVQLAAVQPAFVVARQETNAGSQRGSLAATVQKVGAVQA